MFTWLIPAISRLASASSLPVGSYVLAAATPARYGDPVITDETLERFDPESVQPGDVVGIGIHTGNALRGLEVGRLARERGAWVVYGGIHATLYPEEPKNSAAPIRWSRATATSSGPEALADCVAGTPRRDLRRRTQWPPIVSAGSLGSVPPGALYVGFGTDRSRLSQALFLLLGLAHRRPGAAPAHPPIP